MYFIDSLSICLKREQYIHLPSAFLLLCLVRGSQPNMLDCYLPCWFRFGFCPLCFCFVRFLSFVCSAFTLPDNYGNLQAAKLTRFPPSSFDYRSTELIVSPKKGVGCRGGSRNIEGCCGFSKFQIAIFKIAISSYRISNFQILDVQICNFHIFIFHIFTFQTFKVYSFTFQVSKKMP